ncbi:MAG: pyridoxal 5'-phosphate synthase [Proteobacteria bacterium]|nr:pyridoxal 5'-phosphate synthase [Pseudomonadota bacterium]
MCPGRRRGRLSPSCGGARRHRGERSGDKERCATVLEDAMQKLRTMMEQAQLQGEAEYQSGALATASLGAQPSVRMVYVVHVEDNGPIFMASVHSGKGKQLIENPRVGLCLFWPQMQEQITLEGEAVLLDEAASDHYWKARLRDDQLGVWVSEAAQEDGEAAAPQQSLRAYRQRFRAVDVPRPESWRAFRIAPELIRFWSTGWHRLRNRVCYTRGQGDHWSVSEEQP